MHLTRNETEKCVMARIARQKQLHQKNFTLKQFGTWTKAEAAARKWVKATLLELPPPIGMKNRMTSRNTSGGPYRSYTTARIRPPYAPVASPRP